MDKLEIWKEFEGKLFYLDKTILSYHKADDGIILDLDDDADVKLIKEKVRTLTKDILRSFSRVKTKQIYESNGEINYSQDPMHQLLDTRQVIEIYPGVFALQGKILKSLKKLDSTFRNFALSRGAIEQHYHSTVPTKSLIENGYLQSFTHHPLFVANIFPELKILNNVSNGIKNLDNKQILNLIKKNLGQHEQIISPTVCYHCFETLRDQTIPKDGVEYTAINSCHRFENRRIYGLARLQSFTMREIIFFGNDEYVIKSRNQILEHCKTFFDKLKIQFRVVTAFDPFFTNTSDSKRVFQTVLDLKYEIEAYLPYSNSWLSVASFNNHQSSLVDNYAIDFSSNEKLHSGCVGYGYERLLYAIYAQKGLDFSI